MYIAARRSFQRVATLPHVAYYDAAASSGFHGVAMSQVRTMVTMSPVADGDAVKPTAWLEVAKHVGQVCMLHRESLPSTAEKLVRVEDAALTSALAELEVEDDEVRK